MELRGEETTTLELGGALDRSRARQLVPPRLELEEVAGHGTVGLLLFQMRGLRLQGIPGPAFDYSEALWRIGVVAEGQPGWFAVACDLDHRLVRRLGRLLIRYPTRPGAIAWECGDPTRVEVASGGAALRLSARPYGEQPSPVPPRRAFVGGASIHELPWQEEPAPWRRGASVEVLEDGLTAATLGPVRWHPSGVLHRGRIHRCGLARPHR